MTGGYDCRAACVTAPRGIDSADVRRSRSTKAIYGAVLKYKATT